MIVDVHTHAFPDAIAEAAIARLSAEGGIPAHFDGTVAGLIGNMDRAGIDVAVLQPVVTNAESTSKVNDWAASLASPRILPFGAMHPDTPTPAEEIARMSSLGLRGFKMHPEYQHFAPSDPRLEPILEAATAHGMVILFHAGGDVAFDTVRGTPLEFARMLDRHPSLKAVLAHMGGFNVWDEVREHLLGRDVYLDTAYTLGHLPDEDFIEMARQHGIERVLFGTDGPWMEMADQVARVRSLPLTEEETVAVLGGNAARLLGLQ